MIGLKRGKVKLVPYNPKWVKSFEKEKRELQNTLKDMVIDIQHIGSTAIPGVFAKPIIDIVIGVPDLRGNSIERYIKPLKKLGYNYMGERRSREPFFTKGEEEKRTHYLHLVEFNGEVWKNYLLFRDWLHTHKKAAEEYTRLKLRLLEEFPDHRDLYTFKKERFIKETLRKAKTSHCR